MLLEAFAYDPLVEWTVGREKGAAGGGTEVAQARGIQSFQGGPPPQSQGPIWFYFTKCLPGYFGPVGVGRVRSKHGKSNRRRKRRKNLVTGPKKNWTVPASPPSVRNCIARGTSLPNPSHMLAYLCVGWGGGCSLFSNFIFLHNAFFIESHEIRRCYNLRAVSRVSGAPLHRRGFSQILRLLFYQGILF